MRLVLGLLVVVALGWVMIYFAGGYSAFDPSEQGRQARTALRAGMSFKQACDITGDPRKFRIINRKTERIGGEEIVMMVPAPVVKITRERIDTRLAEGSLPYGFLCPFTYSATVAFTVTYDDTGTVVNVSDDVTVANWMEQGDFAPSFPSGP